MNQPHHALFNKRPLNKAIKMVFAMSLVGISGISQAEDDVTQNPSEPIATLETINIYADSYRTTGTKSALEPEDAPLSYSRIEQKVLEERQADTIAAALRYEPGVSTESRGTVTIFDEYRIRGFESGANYLDGVELPSNRGLNLQTQVDSYATEAVEIVKGSASSLYGYGSPGGIVNQISKVPQQTSAHQVRLKGGTHNLAEVAVDSTGALTDSASYRVVALGRKKDGQMQATEEERYLINPSLDIDVTDNLNFLASLYYQKDPHQVPSTPLPGVGTVDFASYGKLDSDAFAGDEWNNFEKEVIMPTIIANWEINDNLTFKHTSRYTDAEGDQRNTYHLLSPPAISIFVPGTDNLLIRTAYTTEETLKNYSTDNQLAFDFDTSEVNHNILLGAEYKTTEGSFKYSNNYFASTPIIDLTKPNHKQINDNIPLNLYIDQETEEDQVGVYLQDEITFDKLTVLAGLRYDKYDTSTKDNLTNTTTDYDDNETSGRLAAIYHFDNGISPFISYSESYEPFPGVDSDTGKPYQAITSNQIEGGFKYDDGTTKANFAVFNITRENELVPDVYNYRKFKQVGETESRGFEASVQQYVNDWLDIAASYSLTDVEIVRDDTPFIGNTPAQIAKHQANLWTNFYPTESLKLNLGVRYQSGMKIDKANSGKLPAVTLVDVGGSYQINDTFSLGMNINNVFNKEYVGTCYDRNNCWMGQERQGSVSLTADF